MELDNEDIFAESMDEFNSKLSKYKMVMEDLKNVGHSEAAEEVIEMIEHLGKLKSNENQFIHKIETMDLIISDLTIHLSDVAATSDSYKSCLRSTQDENDIIKRELDSAHLREQDYQELIDSLRSQTEFLDTEIDNVKKEQDELATELGISGRTREAYFKDRDRLKKENGLLKSELGTIAAEHDLATNQLDVTKSSLQAAQHQLDDLKLINEELHRDNGYMTKEAALQRSLVHQLKKNLILLKSHHDLLRYRLNDANNNLVEQKTNLFQMQRSNKDLKTAIRNEEKEIKVLHLKIENISQTNSDLKKINKDKENEMLNWKRKVNETEKRETKVLKALKSIELLKAKTKIENKQLIENRRSTQSEFGNMKVHRESMKQAAMKLNRENLLISVHLLKTTNLAAEYIKKYELEARVRRTIEVERDKLKYEVHRFFITNMGLISQKDRCKQDFTMLEQKLEEELLYIRHKEHTIGDLKKEIEELKMKIRKHTSLYDEIKAERNVIARSLSETQDMNDELRRHNKTLSKQLDQLKEQMSIKDGLLIKVERMNKRKMNEGVKLKWQLTKSRNQLKSCKDTAANMEKEQSINLKTLEKAIKERTTVNKSFSKAVNEKAVILTQLDRKTAELNCLQENSKFMNIILKKGDRQYNLRLDDIKILRLEILKLRREKSMVVKTLENTADLRKEIYHLYSDLNRERIKCTALEQEMQTPVNYHRWRILEGSDPDLKDLIDKVSHLQKNLIQTKEKLNQKLFEVDELKCTSDAMKCKLEKMPGIDVYETISRLRNELGHKDEEIQALSSILACSEFELQKLRLSSKMNNESLDEFKKKYYDMKLILDKNKLKPTEKVITPNNIPAETEIKPKRKTLNDPINNITSISVLPISCSS